MIGSSVEVGVFGLYHLGPVIATNLARGGHRVTISDFSPGALGAAAAGRLGILEPVLNEAFADQVESGMVTVGAAEELAARCEAIWIAIDTPMREDNSVDLTQIDAAVELIAEYAPGPRTVLISSQIPVGTTARYQEMLGPRHEVAYIPENLRMGSAMTDFSESPSFVVGTNSPDVVRLVESLVPGRELRVGNPQTAELTKHATNVLLAQLITYGNAIGDVARAVGADGYEVEQNLRADARFGSSLPLRPGARFAGGTLERDIRSLQAVSAAHHLDHGWLDALVQQNNDRTRHLVSILGDALSQPVNSVVLLGWLYKADSTSARDAPGVHWARELEASGIAWKTLDPLLEDDLDGHRLSVEDLPEALKSSDGVIVVRPDVIDRTKFIELMRSAETSPVLDCWQWLAGSGLFIVEPGRK